LQEKPCDIPVWALARDARYVLAVEALSTKIVKEGQYDRAMAKVQVLSSIKEPAPWLPGAIVSAYPDVSPRQEAEDLIPGRRYIVFPVGNDERDQLITKDSPLRFETCGVREVTPGIYRELEKGFAQNDILHP
jgi:hypothetical protein